eukprot:g30221.t1
MGVKTKVFFRWHGVHVASDEEVRVTGSCDELGSWDTSQAVPLSRVEQCKNCWWSVQGVRIPLKEHFEPLGRVIHWTRLRYRYAIFKAQSDDFLRWTVEMEEPHFAVATGRHMTLEDDGGRCRATGDDEIMQLRANAFERQNSHETPPQTPRPSPRMGTYKQQEALNEASSRIHCQGDDKAFLVFRNLPVVVTKSETGEWQAETISDSAGTALPLLKHFTLHGKYRAAPRGVRNFANSGDEDTLVWIHDYELVMVPRFVYHRNPDFTTGLFLHCAFPSTEVMSCLPVREEILQGMLSSRLVTFQTFDYLRHFMSCCSEVEHDARSVVVFADHFAIPYNHLVRKLSDEKVIDRARSIQNEFKGKTIIGSYDRFDCFSGLALKLGIFHRFLMEYRSHRQNVVLVQYVRARYTDSKRFGMVSLEELQQMAVSWSNGAWWS